MASSVIDNYIERTIQWDRACAQRAARACLALTGTNSLLHACAAVARKSGVFSVETSKYHDPNDPILMNSEQVMMAAYADLAMAGESVKQLSRTRPDLVAAYPDFPWVALKRMRDYISHPAREISPHDGDLGFGAIESKFKKDMLRLLEQTGANLPPDDQPEFEVIHSSIWFYKGIQHLLKYAQADDGQILLNKRLVMDVAADIGGIGHTPEGLPALVVSSYRNYLMNALNDRLQQLSPFAATKVFGPEERRIVRSFRNARDQLCHFVDLVYSKEEDPSDSLTRNSDLAYDSAFQLSSLIERGEFARSLLSEVSPDDLQRSYKAAILGKIADDPRKLRIMEQSISWVTSISKNNIPMEIAYIRAVRNLLEKTPASHCADVLDYIQSTNCRLTNTDKLKEAVALSPHHIRRIARSFVADFEEKLSEDKLSTHRITQAARS